MMLKDKVAVVTGSGRGIGKGMAVLMAKEGAKVVVNDIGGASDGSGTDKGIADEVVDEIKSAGGEAVAVYDSVADWEGGQNIIQTAVDSFGKIDILVNNAGILRDRMIFNMTEEEWDGVMAVHLKGTFNCTRAASVYMKQQKSGRVINFTSTSGLIGNYGQANYGAAKLGLVGFTRNCALDMQRYGVTFNAISPSAWTRMIGTIPERTDADKKRLEKLKRMSPDHIAPLVVYLASDQAGNINGQVFGVRAKEIVLYSMPRPVRTIHRDEGWTPQTVAEVIPQAMGDSFFPLITTAQMFSYEPLV